MEGRTLFKNIKKFVIGGLMVTSLLMGANQSFAADHSGHYNRNLWNYDDWEHDSNGKVNVVYSYIQIGDVNYLSEVNQSVYHWDYEVLGGAQPFEFEYDHAVNANVRISSDDFGNVDWIGRANVGSATKTIQLNEYHDLNKGYYTSSYYTVLNHEFGHVFGLDHYDCSSEVMYKTSPNYMKDLYIGDEAGVARIY
ncbi:MAG TPA: matrixin family metalloprotease [Bacillales bacterium]|uniref:matrixin family metalloprotease n=1 Tax=Schinkia azotoformans TaxID=1454 RepID=UPI0018215D0C|nr:matrixin family metalloprotease [Schinkia azotoformans]MEC1721129.1 matrixin family metalloprotease [Schinkia azotoformans]MED4351907.1 matrixin family metalloprotease [Schinkia azotoformans]MED4412380.1 matrixin family metalloprotease [Schinkia azotoformans]HHW37097.1 matrixin family metalloprotease [Bacillales bacterium]